MIKEEQNPTGPVLTAAESRRRVLHNMCSSLLYNLSVILFGLLLPRLSGKMARHPAGTPVVGGGDQPDRVDPDALDRRTLRRNG